jgi:cytochrome c oxidase subunit IV
MTNADQGRAPSAKIYLTVFAGLLLIVATEVFLTYRGLSAGTLLTWLLILAAIEATLAVMYFMHMKYESRALFWSLIPAIIFVFIMLNYLWPDANRVNTLRLPIR